MISVSRLHAILDAGHTAAYDLRGDIEALLPPDGVVLSGDEVAQIREALRNWLVVAGALGIAHTDSKVVDLEAALSLLDSAGEETR